MEGREGARVRKGNAREEAEAEEGEEVLLFLLFLQDLGGGGKGRGGGELERPLAARDGEAVVHPAAVPRQNERAGPRAPAARVL